MRQHQLEAAIRVSGLGQQFPGLVGIVAVLEHLIAVRPQSLRYGASCLLPQSARPHRHHVLVGNAVGYSLTHQLVVQRRSLGVHKAHVVEERGILVYLEVRAGAEAFQPFHRQREGQVHFPAFQHLGLDHLLRDDADDDLVELVVLPAAPIVFEAGQDDLLVGGVALQHPGTRARLPAFLKPLGILIGGGRTHNPGCVGGGGHPIQRVGRGERDLQRHIVQRLDRVHHPPDPGRAGAQIDGALDRLDDCVRRQRLPVVERDPISQLKGPHQTVVRHLVALGQGRLETTVGVDPNQRLVQIGHVERLGRERRAGVPGGHRGRRRHAQHLGSLHLLGRRHSGRRFGGWRFAGRSLGGRGRLRGAGYAPDQGQAKQAYEQQQHHVFHGFPPPY